MARKKAKSEAKSEAPKKIKPISLNILEIAKRLQKLEQTSGGGDHSALANKSDIATEFNTTTAYTAGCFVYHDGKLYQFNADHAAGAWDPTDVVLANVTDQVVSNKAAIDGLTASDVTYDNTTSGLSATKVQGAVDEVAEKMGNMRMTKLWENPSPTNDFVAQSISLSSNDYDMLMVIFRSAKNNTRCCSEITLKGNGATLSIAEYNANGASNRTRTVNYSSDTSLSVGIAKVNGVDDNSQIIPYQIYGIKLT